MTYTFGHVSEEHLETWRKCIAMKNAAAMNPRAFTSAELVEVEMGYYRAAQFIIEEYGIDDEENWMISLFSGKIVYQDN